VSGKVVPIRPGIDPQRQQNMHLLQHRCNRIARLLAAMAFEAELVSGPTVAAAIDSAYHALLAAAHDLEKMP